MTKPIEKQINDINRQIRFLNQEKSTLQAQKKMNELYDENHNERTLDNLEANLSDTLIVFLDNLGIQTIDNNTGILNEHVRDIRDVIVENIKKDMNSFESK